MRVIVVGAGEVGYQVTKFLALEKQDVVVVDRDAAKLERISEEVDVGTVVADGCSPSGLKEAGAENADILLAVTDSDETNMIACMLGKAMFAIPRKIARLRNPEYFRNEKLLSKEHLDIDPAISPEMEVAGAVVRLLETPFATDVEDFEEGLIKVVGFRMPNDSAITGKPLKSIRDLVPPKKFLIGIIERDGTVIIPTGDDVILPEDVIHMPVKKWEVGDAIRFLGASTKPAKKIMIAGGGRVGLAVAAAMESRADVKVIERDAGRSKFISRSLRKAIVLHGDGSDEALLKEENIADMDAFVSVSNNEELNIMSSLLAKRLGAKKTITIVNRPDYLALARGLGLQAVLSPRVITASSILKYVRRGDILSITSVADDKAEILEARIGGSSALINKQLKDVRLPKSALVGAIVREDNKIIIPSGQDTVHEGDKLIFFTLRESIKNVESLLE
ncbi:MAG: Trk system potassium transporter TrkA [Nitrospirota bacterium]|jgi:trk system potassium uptake protein TrkA